MTFRLLSIFALCVSVRLAAKYPDESELKLSVVRAPELASISHQIKFVDGARGSRYLEITLKNESSSDASLTQMVLEFPWIQTGDPDLLVSSGGTTMNTWPGLVLDPRESRPKPPHSGTYLMARHDGGYSFVGFLSWRTFWTKLSYENGRVVMTADGENRRLRAGETVRLEKLWFSRQMDWQDLLFHYGDEIARELDIRLKPQPHYVGWSTWDYFGRDWTAKNITDHVAAIKALTSQASLLQIDGGWWPWRGDFTLVRDDLQPGGMKELATKIHAAGLTAGIHFDGMRGDRSAAVAKAHPDFFLHDDRGEMISDLQKNNDGDRLDNTYFDFSNPGAVNYMREVTKTMRREWGFDYIKIDFLMFGLNEDIRKRALKNDTSQQIVPFDAGLTSVERMHRALQAWREGMGPDAYFLACSAPYGVVYGYADGLRTAPDIFPNFELYQRCSEGHSAAFYLQGRVVWNDADYHVVRAKEDEDGTLVRNPQKTGGALKLHEAAMWSDYVGLFGGTKLNSDNLGTLRDERKALIKRTVDLPACSRYVPLDFWQHGRTNRDSFHVMLGQAEQDAYLGVFNWSDAARDYRISGLSQAEAARMALIQGEARVRMEDRVLVISLPARHSSVFKISEANFDSMRKAVVVN